MRRGALAVVDALPNITFDRTASSRSLAAAGQRARSAGKRRCARKRRREVALAVNLRHVA